MSDEMSPEGVVSAASGAEGITIVRIFDAPRTLVFRMWTEPERFATWFGEPGSTLPLDRLTMDARPGGAWSAIMIYGPDRVELPFSGHFREVVEPERVVLTVDDPTEPGSGRVEVMTVILDELEPGRTRMTFTQTGGNLSSNEYSRAMRGSLIFFERMADELKARHDI